MPDYPDAALAAVQRALIAAADDFGTGDEICGSAGKLARAACDAVAPMLADAVALKILEHAELHSPRQPGSLPTGWDIHFGIAARIAERAFTTEAEMKRQAAEAIDAGEFYACHLGDDGQSNPR